MFTTKTIADIKVGTRRREDFGDIDGLAASISKYGLFHPIIIDGEDNLVAGERRLVACTSLGWTEIPVRFYSELSDAERLEIELEENLQRKDLTSYEASKQLLQTAEKIAERISSHSEEIEPSAKKAGRKSTHGAPKKEIARALGVSTGTLVNAEQQVKAVESYSELKNEPQKSAIEKAKTLDSLSPAKREQVRQNVSRIKKPAPKKPLSKPGLSNSSQYQKWYSEVSDFKAKFKQAGSGENLTGAWQEVERYNFFTNLKELCEVLDQFKVEIGESLNQLQDASGF